MILMMNLDFQWYKLINLMILKYVGLNKMCPTTLIIQPGIWELYNLTKVVSAQMVRFNALRVPM